MSISSLASPRPAPRRGPKISRPWMRWQTSTVSQRVLSEKDRNDGYAVLRVPPPLQGAFLAVAQVMRLYTRRIHAPRRVLSAKQLAYLRAWSEATQALMAVLQEADDD